MAPASGCETTLRAAPADPDPGLPADRFHRLACVHAYPDREDDAIGALGRAVDLSRDVADSTASPRFPLDKALLEL
ncbi:hypothetical protein [Streptomyces sp. NBC_01477]|uniref:hypothetical protein n=1 Tax=Streptomyces sp. NBC_01477 TaxID=2976015 RepID=UPI002E37ED40|nr:hypothetical protein [Streptomyces sp. NBC_01477]